MSEIKELTGSCSPIQSSKGGSFLPLWFLIVLGVPGLLLPPLSHHLSLSSHHTPLLIYKDTSPTKLDFI